MRPRGNLPRSPLENKRADLHRLQLTAKAGPSSKSSMMGSSLRRAQRACAPGGSFMARGAGRRRVQFRPARREASPPTPAALRAWVRPGRRSPLGGPGPTSITSCWASEVRIEATCPTTRKDLLDLLQRSNQALVAANHVDLCTSWLVRRICDGQGSIRYRPGPRGRRVCRPCVPAARKCDQFRRILLPPHAARVVEIGVQPARRRLLSGVSVAEVSLVIGLQFDAPAASGSGPPQRGFSASTGVPASSEVSALHRKLLRLRETEPGLRAYP